MFDGTTASVSSVNWSINSFTNNREAGILLSDSAGTSGNPALKFLQSVFELDWSNGGTFDVDDNYSKADLAVIQSKSTRPVTVQPGPSDRAYITPKPTAITGKVANLTVATSPDWSFATVLDSLNAAKKSVQIYIYQITDPRICDAVEALHKKAGIELTLLVSNAIYSSYDQVRCFLFSPRYCHHHTTPAKEYHRCYLRTHFRENV